MKAYVLQDVNKLTYMDVDYPECKEGWAIVKVTAAGICSSDIPRIFTKGTYHFPTIPGHEFCGKVCKVGSLKDKGWIGKRVGVFPLIPCKKCDSCLNKKYEMCKNYDYAGSRRDGGFAEYVAIPVWNLIELPNEIEDVEAAMLEPLAVSLHAMKMAEIKAGDSVAIIGTGMIGFAAAQWAKSMGADKVCIVGRGVDKKVIADGLGFEYLTTPEGEFDVVLEAVGTVSAIQNAIQLAKAKGKVVLMGNPAGDITIEQSVYWKILRKQLTLMGTWNSSYESCEKCDWTECIDAIKNNRINVKALISHTYNKEQLFDGLMLMKDKKEPYCKVMSIWEEVADE